MAVSFTCNLFRKLAAARQACEAYAHRNLSVHRVREFRAHRRQADCPPQIEFGFTMVEMTVVMMVIAAVMGGAIALVTSSLEGKAYNGTLTKLQTLQQALYDYRLAYNRLPCPANSTVAMSASTFGVEAASTGNCGGGAPAADVSDATAAVGMIPVRTLGLPDDMAIDSWGRRIRYAVAPAFVAADAFDSITATNATARLTVTNNESAATLTTTAAFVLESYGADGHGARGAKTGTLINSGITNANQLTNCKCLANGTADVVAVLASYVQGEPKPDPDDPLNNFDDILVFSRRVDLRSAAE